MNKRILARGLPVFFLAAILAADLAACRLGGSLFDALGPIAGLELGLLIFLNLLGLLLVLDLLADRFPLPGLGWLRQLEARRPAGPGLAVAGDGGELAPALEAPGGAAVAGSSRGKTPGVVIRSVQVLGLAILFYVLEAFLLPFLPLAAGIQYELLLVGAIFSLRLFPALQASRSGS